MNEWTNSANSWNDWRTNQFTQTNGFDQSHPHPYLLHSTIRFLRVIFSCFFLNHCLRKLMLARFFNYNKARFRSTLSHSFYKEETYAEIEKAG
jgi:hypothetical protein